MEEQCRPHPARTDFPTKAWVHAGGPIIVPHLLHNDWWGFTLPTAGQAMQEQACHGVCTLCVVKVLSQELQSKFRQLRKKMWRSNQKALKIEPRRKDMSCEQLVVRATDLVACGEGAAQGRK